MYHMELVNPDAGMIVAVVNQGIDSHLQAVTDSKFTVKDNRLVCDVSPSDLGVIIRRLLETGGDEEYSLAFGIASTLGIDEITLSFDDKFLITYADDNIIDNEVEAIVSVFDADFWSELLDRDYQIA